MHAIPNYSEGKNVDELEAKEFSQKDISKRMLSVDMQHKGVGVNAAENGPSKMRKRLSSTPRTIKQTTY